MAQEVHKNKVLLIPMEYYQIPEDGPMVFDDLGFRLYCTDLAKYQGVGDLEAMENESLFRLFYKMGKLMFGRDCGTQALDFALNRIGQAISPPAKPLDFQLVFNLRMFSV